MKTRGIITVLAIVVVSLSVIGFTYHHDDKGATCLAPVENTNDGTNLNLAISHGHCNMTLYGAIEELDLNIQKDDLFQTSVDFKVNTNTLLVNNDADGGMTESIQKEEIFDGNGEQYIEFTTKDVFQLGENWLQLRGEMSVKGVSTDVKLRATPIYEQGNITKLVIEGQVNLYDFGIEYAEAMSETILNTERTMFINLVCEIGC